MSQDPSFRDLIQRVRAGDQAAAADLVRRHEAAIRRAVRFRLVDTRLGAVLDSMDICQSVMASFFVRAAAGQYELNSPDELVRLLVSMARNKLASQARKQKAARRDVRRVAAGSDDLDAVAARGAGPDEQVAARDLLDRFYSLLSADERLLVERRNQGSEWAAIAAEVGSTDVVLRKKYQRALDRVTREMGLEEAVS